MLYCWGSQAYAWVVRFSFLSISFDCISRDWFTLQLCWQWHAFQGSPPICMIQWLWNGSNCLIKSVLCIVQTLLVPSPAILPCRGVGLDWDNVHQQCNELQTCSPFTACSERGSAAFKGKKKIGSFRDHDISDLILSTDDVIKAQSNLPVWTQHKLSFFFFFFQELWFLNLNFWNIFKQKPRVTLSAKIWL